MKAKYATIFIDSWSTVLSSFSSKQLMSADINIPNDSAGNRDILVFIRIIGEISGQIYISMDAETAKILASEMLGGMEITEDELVSSAVGEFCNMVMGNACTRISSTQANVDITPPMVVYDQTHLNLMTKPSYCISFQLENLKQIDFSVAV